MCIGFITTLPLSNDIMVDYCWNLFGLGVSTISIDGSWPCFFRGDDTFDSAGAAILILLCSCSLSLIGESAKLLIVKSSFISGCSPSGKKSCEVDLLGDFFYSFPMPRGSPFSYVLADVPPVTELSLLGLMPRCAWAKIVP